jgi:hypothetical protein
VFHECHEVGLGLPLEDEALAADDKAIETNVLSRLLPAAHGGEVVLWLAFDDVEKTGDPRVELG